MGLREEFFSVMRLQTDYSSLPTDAMSERGRIIKDRIPALLSAGSETLRLAAGIEAGDLLLKGRDGIGRKSHVPWVRFGSRDRSPSAATGWYVVWLFREDGSGVYLSLSHASTEKSKGDFVRRPDVEIRRLKTWAIDLLESDLREDSRVLKTMALGEGKLAKAYEGTTVASYFYSKEALPSDAKLRADMELMARRLGLLYVAEPSLKLTGETSLDVIAAIEAIEEATTGRTGGSQGFGLTQPERRAVEIRAMAAAIQHFTDDGFRVEDTSARLSYDLVVSKGNESHFIEVKGTTGALGDIVLTRNEVEHHQNNHPRNGLFVLHGIRLNKRTSPPNAEGGTPYIETPWRVHDDRLQAIAYRYRIL